VADQAVRRQLRKDHKTDNFSARDSIEAEVGNKMNTVLPVAMSK
jgi:hypothetical protein